MAYVYTLSNYREDGAEQMIATLVRENLPTLLESRLHQYREFDAQEARESLVRLLQKSDEELSRGEWEGNGHNLMKGWGGEQLHVVELK